jgi:hypothetical protein
MTAAEQQPAVRPGFYFRRGGRWVWVSDPRSAPPRVRVFSAEELEALPDGRLVVKVKP